MQQFYEKYLTSKKRPLEENSPTSSKRSKNVADEIPILPVNHQIPEFFGTVKKSENEKRVKMRLKQVHESMSQKQASHLRELTIKYYGKVIGGVAWNLLLLLYQSGNMTKLSSGSETKALIKKMATKSRSQSVELESQSQNCGRRTKSTTTKSKLKNQLTSAKSQPSNLKKYFIQLVDFESVLTSVKPQSILDSDSGIIVPVVNLDQV